MRGRASAFPIVMCSSHFSRNSIQLPQLMRDQTSEDEKNKHEDNTTIYRVIGRLHPYDERNNGYLEVFSL